MTSQVHLHQESSYIHICILFTCSLVYYVYDQILSLLTKCLNKMNSTSDNMMSIIKLEIILYSSYCSQLYDIN